MDFHCSSRSTGAGARIAVLGAAMTLLISPVRAWPWGCEGHQAVAMIAEKHLNGHAKERANKLLLGVPIDPSLNRYCPSQGLDLMEDSSTWADDLRGSRSEASPWHYIDIPRGASRSASVTEEACPASTGCVTRAIEHQVELLRNDGNDPQVRADALRFIIHFVGDLHQPLHCVSNNDLGGNCVPIDFFGNAPVERNPQSESYSPNLHGIWDSGIIQHIKGMQTVEQWAAVLDHEFSSHAGGWEKQGINVSDWAWEGHEVADSVVYPKLPVAVPVERPVLMKGCSDDDHASTRLLKLHEQVARQYVDAVAPTINEQIAKAGIRLSMILNQIWP